MPQINELQKLQQILRQTLTATDHAIEMKKIESNLPERELCEIDSIEILKKQIFELFHFLGINYNSNEGEKNFFQ
jgi:hypothetical protein